MARVTPDECDLCGEREDSLLERRATADLRKFEAGKLDLTLYLCDHCDHYMRDGGFIEVHVAHIRPRSR